jgi:SAM-dependent methyltransferase
MPSAKGRAITVRDREQEELRFWEESETESPQSDSIENILNKAAGARVFLEKLGAYSSLFANARSILELGAGQCWASCIVKRLYPDATVTATDISPAAVASAKKWEHIYRTQLDRVLASRAFDTPFEQSSFDLIFAYSAAHHFAKHRRTFRELARILQPGGCALYLHEPGCPAYLYGLALRRVNAKRIEVFEDVLRYRQLVELGKEFGLNVEYRFAPTVTNRGPVETIYYFGLQKVPVLQRVLPSTVDIIIRKSNK